jgi:hypothetical protein
MGFQSLSRTARAYLEEMLGGLAGMSAGDSPRESSGATVVSEILPGD